MTEVGYASDKPSDCAYCYFFSAGERNAKGKNVFIVFLLRHFAGR